jgi:hypothetical protein
MRPATFAVLCIWLATSAAFGQSPFDPPAIPAEGGPSPGVRGLRDQSEATDPPAPARVEGAPPATFAAPAGAESGEPATAATLHSAESVSADARPIEGSQIIARVDGQVILASDLLWQVNQIIAANRDRIPPDQIEPARQALLRRQLFAPVDYNMTFLDSKALFADFARTVPAENMPKIEEQIAEGFEKQELPRLVKMLKVKDRVELDTLLNASGTSVKDMQRQFTEKVVAGEWLRQRTPKPKPVTLEQIRAYYDDHLKEYEYPAQVRWEEIMVRFDRVGGDRDAAWKALAEMGNEVWQAAAANPGVRGPVFGAVAKGKSHGFTADQGGVHDWTTLGSLKCEEINQALAGLELGQMSDGVESELGFHIVRVLERKAAGRTPFTEAQAKIRESLEREQKEVLFAAELAEVRKAARVWTIFDGDLTGARLAEVLSATQRR